ncbi:MAG TPA: YfhO family protein, partial [Dehalococcoidia bacterium]|nr:YfhO family protein [Dehalococcoidia bacterium]
VPDAEVLSRDAILERLRSPDFDPRAMVLLEAGGTDPTASAAGAVGGGRARDAAGVAVVQVTSDPNELVVSTSGDEPAYLFVSEVFYPGWQATVDGGPTEILRANFLFRAVALPAGSHEVRFVFRPLPFYVGAAISGLTLVALIALAAWPRLRPRGQRRAGEIPATLGTQAPPPASVSHLA